MFRSIIAGVALALALPAALAAQDVQQPEIPDMAMGDADAPVTVIEYGAFTCPHCADFHDQVLPQLTSNYIDTGDVRFVYREFYLHQYGLWASMVARCGAEDRFFGISDMLFDRQAEWTSGETPQAVADNLRAIGRSAGLSAEQLDACFSDGDKAEALVAWSQANGEADNITGTPTLVINGETYSNMSYEDLAQIIDDELAADG